MHRRGDDRGELAARRALGRARERREHVGGVARIERARHGPGAERHRHDAKLAGRAFFYCAAVVSAKTDRKARGVRRAREEVGIGDGNEICRDLARGEFCDELGADAGRFSGRDREAG